MSQERILVVDDKIEIAELLRDYLEAEDYQVKIAADGEVALDLNKNFKPQLIILDLMLPVIDGFEVCRIIRSESDIPILILSAKSSDMDKVLGLGLGADDYITKPFSSIELVARVKAQLRRYIQLSEPRHKPDVLKYDGLEIDMKAYSVCLSGQKLTLTTKEFEILKLLALHPSQVFTKEQVLDSIWGYHEYGDMHSVTVYIRKIREKIENDPSNPQYLKTVWGVGYMFEGGKKA